MLALMQGASAQDLEIGKGWTLMPESSSLNFQSVKNVTKVESSRFAKFSGGIDPAGAVSIRVLLDSVDTKVDLRNVRMRFLLFETFKFPEAVISATIDPSLVSDLPAVRRKTVPLTYSLDLHGVTKGYEAEVAVTMISDNVVSVASTTPIAVPVEDFALMDGVRKLEEAAKVTIIPHATISFDFVFTRNGASTVPVPATSEPPAKAATAALETQGDFGLEECNVRFDTLSQTGHIYFRAGSSRLDGESGPLLESLALIIQRCPGMTVEVSGHTDADGSDDANQRLSDARARAVAEYLTGNGINARRLMTVGHGETMPVVPNDSAENKARNRRIEFAVING